MVKISLYICCSADGFIADKNGGVSWLPPMGPEAQRNYEKFFDSVGMVIMGSRSYKKVLSFGVDWPYAGKISYVFTKQELQTGRDDVKTYGGDPSGFIEMVEKSHSDVDRIWLMGGAELTKSFEVAGLIDDIILFKFPKTLGDGIPLGINLENFDKTNEGSLEELTFAEYKCKS